MVNKRYIEGVWPTPRLLRAARGLTGVDQSTLGKLSGVSRQTVIAIESCESDAMEYRRYEALQRLQEVFEKQFGIEFLSPTGSAGEGLRLRKRTGR
jgi:DNA-binding XRE family transcriptional regulator